MNFLLIAVLAVAAAQVVPAQPDNASILHSEAYPIGKVVDVIEGAPKYPASRVISGTQAERGQFPYQAALYVSTSSGTGFCGGSLISQRWVLTAAHCALGVNSFTVYLGAQNLNAASESGRVVAQTRTKVVHSGYTAIFAPNDVAVVDLGQDVALSSYIQPIALATGSDLYEGVTARISGWGRTSDASNAISPVLNYADLTVISNAVCRQTYGSINVRASTICTLGSNGRATCNGDSGGPLIEVSSGKQIGIVSFGHVDGCEVGAPNGFARVTSYVDWISANTGLSI